MDTEIDAERHPENGSEGGLAFLRAELAARPSFG
jgi:hypothetical protein